MFEDYIKNLFDVDFKKRAYFPSIITWKSLKNLICLVKLIIIPGKHPYLVRQKVKQYLVCCKLQEGQP